ncbi:uncharacterized protein LOC142320244 [Lycorma delicatula]|uniref:uncharacterized protein LOC142320244 n=1 Tax=Lycorma delicatula TaxID=130591 RepID=UPI003F511EF2
MAGKENKPKTKSDKSSDNSLIIPPGGDGAGGEGYGHRLPLRVLNIWNKGGNSYYNIVKNSRCMTLDFTSDQGPIPVPYQYAGFWTSMWCDTEIANNQTINLYNELNKLAWGVTWVKGEIKLEIYNVLRQRLLQGGSTNYTTYEFEGSQNLVIGTYDRCPLELTTTKKEDVGPTYHLKSEDNKLYSETLDIITKEEIEQRKEYKKTIHFPTLTHNYCYKPNKIDKWDTLIPGVTGTTLKTQIIKPGTELLSHTITGTQYLGSGTVFQNRVTYPGMTLGQPYVEDETGVMKFKYFIRISTELHLIHHMKPDYNNDKFKNRYTDKHYLYRQLHR